MRQWIQHQVEDTDLFRKKVMRYFSAQAPFVFFDSCGNTVYGEHSIEWMCGSGAYAILQEHTPIALQQFLEKHQEYVTGHFTYDVKNQLEVLRSGNADRIGAPEMYFFVPEILVRCTKKGVEVGYMETYDRSVEVLITAIENTSVHVTEINGSVPLFHAPTPKEKYVQTIYNIQEEIRAGEIYEMNYCQEFYAENIQIDPVDVFEKLREKAQAPYSVLYRLQNIWCISASPELFLQKRGNELSSKPIKGTRPRGKDAVEEEVRKQELMNSEKDKAEHIMIVDLVRNDLSRSAQTGTIEVKELFGLYSFPQVHHLVSTITAQIDSGTHAVEAIMRAFPMGSMTGAPKVRAMECIEKYEDCKRGMYSGAIGFFTPELDCTFNVVIRSLLYRSDSHVLSLQAGGAIVYDSDPEEEYAECLHKLSGILQVLGAKIV